MHPEAWTAMEELLLRYDGAGPVEVLDVGAAMSYGDGDQARETMKVRAKQGLTIDHDGESMHLAVGEEYDLPLDQALKLARAGLVTLVARIIVEAAVIEPRTEAAVLPRPRRRGGPG